MAVYRSLWLTTDPTRRPRSVRFRPGLHILVLAPILVLSVGTAAYLAERGSLAVTIHMNRVPEETRRPSPVDFFGLPSFLAVPQAPIRATYETHERRLFHEALFFGDLADWAQPFELVDCRIEIRGRDEHSTSITDSHCSKSPPSPRLRMERERALAALEAFRNDDAARSIDVAYGSLWGGATEAMEALVLGALVLAVALFRRAAITVDAARGLLRIEDRQLLSRRRQIEIPLADVKGVCIETLGDGLLRHRACILSRAGRIPITMGTALGEERHVRFRRAIEAALAAGR